MSKMTWEESSLYISKELERLNTCYCRIDKKLDSLHDCVLILKLKAGVWGLMGAAIPVAVMFAVSYLKTH